MKIKEYFKMGVVSGLVIWSIGCSSSINSLGVSNKSSKIKLSNIKSKNEYLKYYKLLKEENKTDDLLWTYKAGTVAYFVSKYPESVKYFDSSENLIKKYDTEVWSGKLLANVGAILTNDTFMDYRPKIYEKIMVNTYKGIDFILDGDYQNARIEFNRALVRQQRAKEFFKKEINIEKKKLEEKNKKEKGFNIAQKNLKNKKVIDPIEKKYSNLFAFKAYPDFVNPFTTYLAGLYFLNIGDYSKATDLLKESYGMIKGIEDGDKYVLNDFKMADRLKDSLSKNNEHYSWVIFVNGRGPIKKEWRFNIPVFLFSDNVIYTGIALPTLKIRNKPYDYLLVNNGSKKSYPTKTVGSMDNVIKTEFKKRFPYIMQRALIRTITQTVIQKQLNDKAGLIGGLLGAAYQATMNRADTRMWDSLPKEYQVVRVKTTKLLKIYTPDNQKVYTLKTNPNKNYLIFVTIQSKDSEPIIQYQQF